MWFAGEAMPRSRRSGILRYEIGRSWSEPIPRRATAGASWRRRAMRPGGTASAPLFDLHSPV